MKELRARISFKTGLFITMLGFLFAIGGSVTTLLTALPEVSQALFTLTMGDAVQRAFFLSGSIATVVIGLLLFYIGYDKIRQKQFMEVVRREVVRPQPSGPSHAEEAWSLEPPDD